MAENWKVEELLAQSFYCFYAQFKFKYMQFKDASKLKKQHILITINYKRKGHVTWLWHGMVQLYSLNIHPTVAASYVANENYQDFYNRSAINYCVIAH